MREGRQRSGVFIFIGMGFTFSLQILFLCENGKPLTATSEWMSILKKNARL